MAAAVEVRDLVKTYGSARVIDDVSFTIEEGEVFAFLGPNGAGKTTTIEILEGHRQRTSGDVSVLGFDPATGGREMRDRFGIVLQSSGIDRELTVREVLDLYRSAYTRRRPVAELIEMVGLEEKVEERVSTLSGGQQRRLDLALGLVGDPDLIFLDEPTTGFDPAARRRSWQLIESLTSLGRTVVLTTHYLDEAEHLADRVAVLNGGRIVAVGSPAELREAASTDTMISFRLPVIDSPVGDLLDPLVGRVTGRSNKIEIVTSAPTADLAHITAWAVGRGVELEGLVVTKGDLEDAYLGLLADDERADGERAGGERAGGNDPADT